MGYEYILLKDTNYNVFVAPWTHNAVGWVVMHLMHPYVYRPFPHERSHSIPPSLGSVRSVLQAGLLVDAVAVVKSSVSQESTKNRRCMAGAPTGMCHPIFHQLLKCVPSYLAATHIMRSSKLFQGCAVVTIDVVKNLGGLSTVGWVVSHLLFRYEYRPFSNQPPHPLSSSLARVSTKLSWQRLSAP
jgi:hypothetical protein